MKGRKLLALLLVLALAVGLAGSALAAQSAEKAKTHADFADLKDPRYQWAWATVDDAIARGLFVGYDPVKDAQGNEIVNFGPDDPVTMAVGLTLCARVMVDKETREQILADHLVEMRELIPGTAENPDDASAPYVWFRREAATCLELGVLEKADLVELIRRDQLGKTMTKADFALYLVRAMGLEDFARSLNSDNLVFTDAAQIDAIYRPCAKLLYDYGVLQGDERGNFSPDSSMSRAVCATMLSRAAANIVEGRKVSVELPQYTKYKWTSGYIQSVEPASDGCRTLTLDSEITGEAVVTLSPYTTVYQHNMVSTWTALKEGAFAKVCYDEDGKTVKAVRVTPAAFLTRVTGRCGEDLDPSAILVDDRLYTIDRFTQVSAGGRTGDRTVIDYAAGYTDADMAVDSRGNVAWLKLSGGTRLVDGVLTDVIFPTQGTAEKTRVTVAAYNGLPTTYQVSPSVEITAGGELAELKESYEGRHVRLRVADGDLSQLKALDVDMTNKYIQGVLRSVTDKAEEKRVEITLTGAAKRTAYDVAEDCDVRHMGAEAKLGALGVGSFVTAKVEGATITELSAWQGYEDTEGTLTLMEYDNPIRLEVTREDGTVVKFTITPAELGDVSVTSGGKDADITKLKTGDAVVVTTHLGEVTQVDFTSQAANVTGTLDAITFKLDGTAELKVVLAGGTSVTYTAGTGTTVLQSGTPIPLTDVKAGSQVALLVKGTRLESIEITGSASRQNTLRGVIYTKDDQARVATIQFTDSDGVQRLVRVHIPSGTNINDVSGSSLTNISRLSVGETIQAWGSYAADGTFEATLVVRE